MAKIWLLLFSHAALVVVLHGISSSPKNGFIKRALPDLKKKPPPNTKRLMKTDLRQGIDQALASDSTVIVLPISSCSCSKIYDPVCASNNKSYFNPCQMDCQAKQSDEAIYILHQGSCIPFK